MRVIASIYAIHYHTMKLLVNDLKLYFGLMFLLPLTLAGHKLHLTLPAGSFFHLLVFLTLIGGGSPTTT